MQISFSYRTEDFIAASRSHKPPANMVRRYYAAFALFLVCIVFFSMLRFGEFAGQRVPGAAPKVGTAIIYTAILVAIAFFSLVLTRIMKRQNLCRALEASIVRDQPHTLDLAEEGLTITTTEAQTRWEWHAFQRLIDAPGVLLLYTAPTTFLIVPKRIFSPNQLNTFTQLCRQNIHEPLPGAFPVLPPSK